MTHLNTLKPAPAKYDLVKKRYSITSTSFEGEMAFTYNEEGILTSFFNEAQLSTAHLKFLHENFPVVEVLLEKMAGKSETLKIRLTTNELTFDEFYEAYKLKVNKPEAIAAWDKLTPAEKLTAFENIPAYNYFLMSRPNQNKLYPDTYLRGKFKNDYQAMARATKGQAAH